MSECRAVEDVKGVDRQVLIGRHPVACSVATGVEDDALGLMGKESLPDDLSGKLALRGIDLDVRPGFQLFRYQQPLVGLVECDRFDDLEDAGAAGVAEGTNLLRPKAGAPHAHPILPYPLTE